jgi:putative hydrolase of the HAD superfamily
MGKLRLVVFDGDDTLWETQSLYTAAKSAFIEALEVVGLSGERVRNLLEAIDVANVKVMGFSRSRFPQSMVETYQRLCLDQGRTHDPFVDRQLREIGNAVFDQKPNLVPSAEEVLKRLQNEYELALCTKGDPMIQEQRISQSGLEHYFDRIYIVPKKDESEFKVVLEDFRRKSEEGCSVGNSIRSDINPALRIGMSALLVPSATWAYEEVESETASGNIMKLSSIEGVPKALVALAAGK